MTTPAQLRAARHLLGLSQAAIASATALSLPTIKRAEGERDVPVSSDAVAAIRGALEAAGVEFLAPDNGGPGVKLRKRG